MGEVGVGADSEPGSQRLNEELVSPVWHQRRKRRLVVEIQDYHSGNDTE